MYKIYSIVFIILIIILIIIKKYKQYKQYKEYGDYGEIIGKTKEGVICYSNKDKKYNKYNYNKYNNSKIYTGEKWECVEFVRRYFIETKNITFQQVDNAYGIFDLNFFIDLKRTLPYTIYKYKNGQVKPLSNDIIIFHNKNTNNGHGHVCIISDIENDKIKIIEQNYDNKKWNKNYSRKIFYDKKNKLIISNDNNEKVYGIIRME